MGTYFFNNLCINSVPYCQMTLINGSLLFYGPDGTIHDSILLDDLVDVFDVNFKTRQLQLMILKHQPMNMVKSDAQIPVHINGDGMETIHIVFSESHYAFLLISYLVTDRWFEYELTSVKTLFCCFGEKVKRRLILPKWRYYQLKNLLHPAWLAAHSSMSTSTIHY
ncbi:hypothetical protein RDWZM_004232 [Blomia tropicalis]|uniref:Uncharacterized protein n=1 Tax=Blomia tropicalis TaxID=40697 RepID=A0A9Q0MJZ1_BLOTA|nr:hypothetical protein BLOT_016457 [Blomia tropicalis]KAJ6225687.1 hypothetical protein RDWZM_004232 [Blomia tropicalis]